MDCENSNGTKKEVKAMCQSGFAGSIYGLGFLGALVYFIKHAGSFWQGLLGIIKAVLWPAVILYKVLELLNM